MIYVTIFLLPLGPKFSSSVGNIHVTSVFILGIIVLWLMTKTLTMKYVRTKLDLPIFCFITVYATFVGIHFLRGNADRTGFLRAIQTIEYVILYFLVVDLFNTRKQIERLLYLFFTAIALETIAAIAHYYLGLSWIDKFYTLESQHRAYAMVGTFSGEHNGFVHYILLGIMLILGFALRTKEARKKTLLCLSLIPLVYCWLFSMSRTAYVTLPAGIFVLLFIDKMHVLKRIKRIVLATVLTVAMIFAVSSCGVFRLVRARGITIHTVLSESPYSGSIGTRTKGVWDVVSEVFFSRNPFDTVFGIGIPEEVIHNGFAKVLYNAGVVGLVVYIWLVFSILRTSLRTLKMTPRTDGFMNSFSVGFTGALIVGFTIFNFSVCVISVHKVIGTTWILLGAASAYRVKVIPRLRRSNYLPVVRSQASVSRS